MKQHRFSFLFFVLILMFLISCLSSVNRIFLDPKTSFQIPSDSKLIRIIQADVDYYQIITNQSFSNQLILYKLINGPNYQMYIGVAIDITIKQLNQRLSSNKIYKLVDQKTPTTDSEAMLLQLDSSRFCFHYIKQFRKGDKYLFSVISDNKDFLEEMFNSNILENSFVDD